MKRKMFVSIAALLSIYLLLCLGLFLAQRSLLYFPQPRHTTGLPTIDLTTDEGPVLVTVRPQAGARAVIYFGGNAEDVTLSLPGLAQAFPGQALYLMHYRGYGGSAGRPSEAALFADALALYARIAQEHAQVTVVGRSLGSGVATYLASQRPVSRLVLVTPYDSMVHVAAGKFPYVPVRWLLQDRFESWRYAPKVSASTVLLAAESDEVIPMKHARALLQHFRQGLASLEVIPAVGHNSISESPMYGRLLAQPQRQEARDARASSRSAAVPQAG